MGLSLTRPPHLKYVRWVPVRSSHLPFKMCKVGLHSSLPTLLHVRSIATRPKKLRQGKNVHIKKNFLGFKSNFRGRRATRLFFSVGRRVCGRTERLTSVPVSLYHSEQFWRVNSPTRKLYIVPCEFWLPEDFLKCRCNHLNTCVARVAYFSSPRTPVQSVRCKLTLSLYWSVSRLENELWNG